MTTTAPPTATGPVTVALDGVSFQYPGVAEPSLRNVDLQIHEGELILVIGPTGSGKTTFLRSINGLVPHFSGGLLRGRVSVVGRDTEHNAPRELADLIGFVPQDPADSFVCDTVEEELAYAMENLGIAPVVMRRRVEETLDLLSITDLRGRNTATLSGASNNAPPSPRCSPPHPGSSCSTSRPHRWTPQPPRRCSPPSPGSCTMSGSLSSWPSTASSGSDTSPIGSS